MVFVADAAFVTVSETWYGPAAAKVWLAVTPVAVAPSPKVQAYEVIDEPGAVEPLPLNEHTRFEQDDVKLATGGCGGGGVLLLGATNSARPDPVRPGRVRVERGA